MKPEDKEIIDQQPVEESTSDELQPIVEPVVEEEPAKTERPTLQEVIKERATEDEAPQSTNFSLRRILLGDVLNTSFVRSQIWLILLITIFLFIYISNRYSCQQSLIKIDRLKEELKDAKFRALSSSSQLTEKCRETNVLEMLKTHKDSVLHHADQPPYIISIPNK